MKLEVLNTKENKDGSLTIEMEIDNEGKELIKRVYNKKKFTKKLLERFIIDGVKSKYNETKKAKKSNK